jgi:hypothetical protein
LHAGVHKFSKNLGDTSKFFVLEWLHKVPYRRPTILEGALNLSVIWRFLLGACKLIHIFVCKGNKLQKLCWKYEY